MQTTEIVVEILVIGGGVTICLTPIVAEALGVSTSSLLQGVDLKELLVVAITAVYPLGILWNRLADAVFNDQDQRLRASYFPDRDEYHRALVRIHLQNAAFGDRLYQVRSLYRIARASTLTFILAACTIPEALSNESNFHPSLLGTYGIATFFLGCAGLSIWTWRHTRKSFLDWARRAVGLVETGPNAKIG